jgi:hypothetical protein
MEEFKDEIAAYKKFEKRGYNKEEYAFGRLFNLVLAPRIFLAGYRAGQKKGGNSGTNSSEN